VSPPLACVGLNLPRRHHNRVRARRAFVAADRHRAGAGGRWQCRQSFPPPLPSPINRPAAATVSGRTTVSHHGVQLGRRGDDHRIPASRRDLEGMIDARRRLTVPVWFNISPVGALSTGAVVGRGMSVGGTAVGGTAVAAGLLSVGARLRRHTRRPLRPDRPLRQPTCERIGRKCRRPAPGTAPSRFAR
jgi:hypothetical protein